MIFSSLGRGAPGLFAGQGRHAREDQGRAAAEPPPARARCDAKAKPARLIETTVGRVIFNEILPEGMPYYNIPHALEQLATRHHRLLPDPRPPQDDRPARRHEAARLPREHPQRPVVRHRRPDHARQQGADHRARPRRRCSSKNKLYQRGIITEGERYNQVLDAWTHAREQITTEMMSELENDVRDGAAT